MKLLLICLQASKCREGQYTTFEERMKSRYINSGHQELKAKYMRQLLKVSPRGIFTNVPWSTEPLCKLESLPWNSSSASLSSFITWSPSSLLISNSNTVTFYFLSFNKSWSLPHFYHLLLVSILVYIKIAYSHICLPLQTVWLLSAGNIFLRYFLCVRIIVATQQYLLNFQEVCEFGD